MFTLSMTERNQIIVWRRFPSKLLKCINHCCCTSKKQHGTGDDYSDSLTHISFLLTSACQECSKTFLIVTRDTYKFEHGFFFFFFLKADSRIPHPFFSPSKRTELAAPEARVVFSTKSTPPCCECSKSTREEYKRRGRKWEVHPGLVCHLTSF